MKKPVAVKFTQKPSIKPIHKYERKWWVLWLINVQVPQYELEDDLVAEVTFDDGSAKRIVAKKGYKTDLASIPRIFWSIFTPDGVYRYIAILHDILYQTELFSRDVCDLIFRLGLTDLPSDSEKIFYYSVRFGGRFVWNAHTRASIEESKQYLQVDKLS
jgi:hypothetical protein